MEELNPVPIPRELTITEILSYSFDFFAKNFKDLFLLMLVPMLPISIIVGIFLPDIGDLFKNLQFKDIQNLNLFTPTYTAIIFASLIFSIFLQIIISRYVKEMMTGRRLSFLEALSGGLKRILPVLGATIMLFLFIFLSVLVPLLITIPLKSFIANPIIILFVMLIIILIIIVLVIYFVFYLYAIAISDKKIFQSFKYSYLLVKGRWWKTFGYLIVFGIIDFLVSLLISLLFMVIGLIAKNPVVSILENLFQGFTYILLYIIMTAFYVNFQDTAKVEQGEQIL